MANKFDKAIKNRSKQIMEAGKTHQEEPASHTSASLDLSEILPPIIEKKAKGKTYYLSEEVINGIKSLAKQHKISESKLVNSILKKALNID